MIYLKAKINIYFFILLSLPSICQEVKNKVVDYEYIHHHFQYDYNIIESTNVDTLSITDYIDTTNAPYYYKITTFKFFIKNSKFKFFKIPDFFKNTKFEFIIKSCDTITINSLFENDLLQKNIESLVLNEVDFKEMPSNLNKLINLKKLSFADCECICNLDLKKLPSNLTKLCFLGTKLESFSNNINNTKIESLELDVVKQDEIPMNIDKLNNLGQLSLFCEKWNDRFKIYNFKIYTLNRLLKLNLKQIFLGSIDLSNNYNFINKFNNLQTLDFFNCNISSIDKLKNINSLKSLSLNSNKIVKFPRNLNKLKNLKSLDMDNNPLDSLSLIEYEKWY